MGPIQCPNCGSWNTRSVKTEFISDSGKALPSSGPFWAFVVGLSALVAAIGFFVASTRRPEVFPFWAGVLILFIGGFIGLAFMNNAILWTRLSYRMDRKVHYECLNYLQCQYAWSKNYPSLRTQSKAASQKEAFKPIFSKPFTRRTVIVIAIMFSFVILGIVYLIPRAPHPFSAAPNDHIYTALAFFALAAIMNLGKVKK
jgi:hypothetical protein